MQQQHDKDIERAKRLSELYGSDINPSDNSLLTKAIFTLFEDMYNPEQLAEITFFCHDQDFGRKAGVTVGELWNKILKQIDVRL